MTKSRTKSMSSSIEKEIDSCNFSLSAYVIELISSLFSWGEIIDLSDETICCIVGLLLGSPDQHANWKNFNKINT